nr:molybdopterin-dependent oxidoreductase [Kibdelosporangium sp. MJ126-NF4]CEL19785.1 hypothetical protein [Kibdelosporangium sp. MJ126-NF4]CTQ97010.1 hypothetical protein [Kibdelosporangium sp. MJ126-NF4]
MSPALPRGQQAASLERFGLPSFAAIRPAVPVNPVVWVTGAVRQPVQLDLTDLLALPEYREQRSDLHCVTTWSSPGLLWGGVPFRAVHEMLAPQVRPRQRCRWVAFSGLDGFRGCLSLEDALADDVLIADTLDGQPLRADQGAPARLVAPAHYGYKNVRHLCAIEYRLDYDPGPARWLGHPRGRVAHEERSRFLPGWMWRPLWRAMVPRVRAVYARKP